MFRISVWWLKRDILDINGAVQLAHSFAQLIVKFKDSLSCAVNNGIKTIVFVFSQLQNPGKALSFLIGKTNMDPLFCIFTVRDVTLAEDTPSQVALELHKECCFFHSVATTESL